MDDFFLPLAYLNAWEYCPRRFYLECVCGEWEDNEYTLMGQHMHRSVQVVGALQESGKRVFQQQWVWSEKLKVGGIIDRVEVHNGQLVPVEYKKGRMGRYLNDHFQLCAAALCLEERTGVTIPYGEIFYHGSRRRQQVYFTADLRQATAKAISSVYQAMNGPVPAPISHQGKCAACSIYNICLPREVRHLQQERQS